MTQESYDLARENYRENDPITDPEFFQQENDNTQYGGSFTFELYGMSWMASRTEENDVYILTHIDGTADEFDYLAGLDDDEEYTP